MSSSIQSGNVTSASPLLSISIQDTQGNPPASQGRFGNRNVIKTSAVGALVGSATGMIATTALALSKSVVFAGGAGAGMGVALGLIAGGVATGTALAVFGVAVANGIKSHCNSSNNEQSTLGQREYIPI